MDSVGRHAIPRLASFAGIALLLGACVATPGGSAPEIPITAIKIADDLYMVPFGPDTEGCEQFRPFSQRSFVAQVVYYRTDDGRFVPKKAMAFCKP